MPVQRPLSMRPLRASQLFLRTRIWAYFHPVLSGRTRISPLLWIRCSPRMRFWGGSAGPLSPDNFSRPLRWTRPWPSLRNRDKAPDITSSYLSSPPGKYLMWRWLTWPAPGLSPLPLTLGKSLRNTFSTPTSACWGGFAGARWWLGSRFSRVICPKKVSVLAEQQWSHHRAVPGPVIGAPSSAGTASTQWSRPFLNLIISLALPSALNLIVNSIFNHTLILKLTVLPSYPLIFALHSKLTRTLWPHPHAYIHVRTCPCGCAYPRFTE